MRAYWWNAVPNLGDRLTEMLLRHYKQDVEWTEWNQAEFVGIGSILELFDKQKVTVWGTGRAGPRAPATDLSRANILALRGKMTQKLVNKATPVLGDPGLLVSDLQPRRYGGTYTAIVPHWRDQERMQETFPGAEFVDVTGDPMKAIRQISGAEQIVASSLHGIILADAYAIPRMWDWFDDIQAGGFKFHDYATVVGHFDPGEWHQPDPEIIHSLKVELREALLSP